MVALPCAPDHQLIDRTRRSQPKGADMLSTTSKRTIATALTGAAIAGTLGAPAASAMPIDPVLGKRAVTRPPIGAPGEPYNTWDGPSPRSSAPAAAATAPDAGFDLSSAAIGAAAGTGLLIVVLAAGGLAWRPAMTRRHGAAGV
jgi:hypothetical protein